MSWEAATGNHPQHHQQHSKRQSVRQHKQAAVVLPPAVIVDRARRQQRRGSRRRARPRRHRPTRRSVDLGPKASSPGPSCLARSRRRELRLELARDLSLGRTKRPRSRLPPPPARSSPPSSPSRPPKRRDRRSRTCPMPSWARSRGPRLPGLRRRSSCEAARGAATPCGRAGQAPKSAEQSPARGRGSRVAERAARSAAPPPAHHHPPPRHRHPTRLLSQPSPPAPPPVVPDQCRDQEARPPQALTVRSRQWQRALAGEPHTGG